MYPVVAYTQWDIQSYKGMKYSFIQLAFQVARIRLTMQDTQVQSLGQEDPWGRKQQPTPVFLPGKLHGQRSQESTGSKRVGHE